MRTYVIVNVTDLELLDYGQLMTTSIETTMRNVNNDKAVVKYEGAMPSTITELVDKTLYDHTEILSILQTDEWRGQPDEE